MSPASSKTRSLTPVLDGSDLSELSKKYNIHISVKPKPLSIYLEGSRESVREVEIYVDGVKKARYFFTFVFYDMLIGQ